MTELKWILLGNELDDNGDHLYWSNDEGWTQKKSATRFTMNECEAFNEPQGSLGWMADL